ncbi:hypothetical protein BSL78_18552 [Apostichopus japonicus]|uniref:Uncharacterized protein n=1 Tax=Stichopus japonicus TaxID=307972 RepID=A0A2G8K9C5_STIJA|nr:hypothetical protein BSL78_18552 [Apostichopus japonicus]
MSRSRKTKQSEEQRAVDACLKGKDTEGCQVKFIDGFIDKKRERSVEVKARIVKKRRCIKWTESDKKLVKKHFHSIITDRPAKTVPNKTEVEAFVKIAKLSKLYPWNTVRTKVMNESEKWKKRSTDFSLFTS